MRIISPQRFILYGRTFIIPALCMLFVAGLYYKKAEFSHGRFMDHIIRLEGSVTAQEGIRAVKHLQYTYGYCLEMGLWNDISDLFSDDAIGRFQGVTLKGKEAIRNHLMAEAGRRSNGISYGKLNVHIIMQPVITLGPDGRTAKGTWHEMAMLGEYNVSATWRGGVYENEYVFEDGVWKISRLNYIEQYHGDYDARGFKAPPRWNIPYHFKAGHAGVTIPASAVKALSPESSSIAVNARIVNLKDRIRKMKDETMVRNLQHIYGYYLDRKMWDDVIDLFTDNCTFETGQRGVFNGKASIRDALEHFYGPSPLRRGEVFDHINVETVVTESPDGMSSGARTRQLCMLGINGEYAQWEVGTYVNDFVKEKGVWKIKAIRYYPQMITDYDDGWAINARPVPSYDREFLPDRAPSSVYKIYPDIYYLRLGFRNPVTGRVFDYPEGNVISTGSMKQSRIVYSEMTPSVVLSKPSIMLPELEHELDTEIAVDAVENLNSAYGYYIDESDWDSMADIFAKKGSKEITAAGVYVGRERIRKVLKLHGSTGGRPPGFFTIHQLVQPVIHISDDCKKANARLRLFQYGGSADGSTGSWTGGIYENTAIWEKGKWKFGVLDLIPEIIEPAFHYKNPVSGRMPGKLVNVYPVK